MNLYRNVTATAQSSPNDFLRCAVAVEENKKPRYTIGRKSFVAHTTELICFYSKNLFASFFMLAHAKLAFPQVRAYCGKTDELAELRREILG